MKRRNRIMRRRAAALALATAALGAGTGLSSTAIAQNGSAAIDASDNRVSPNERVTLDGRFPTPATTTAPGNDAAGRSQPIRIEFRALGSKRWRNAVQTRTKANGRFSRSVAVTRSGRFRAVSSDGRTTRPELVTVRSELKTKIGNDDPKLGDEVTVRGHVLPAGGGRPVTVQAGGEKLRTKTRGDGSFKVKYTPSEAGTETVHVRADGDNVATGSTDKAGHVTTFRGVGASYYGPGLYGNGVACGGTLQPGTIGVAHKTLPCGTKLTIKYGNETVKNVEVIDRGPYVAGREIDLTEALRTKLGFGGVGTVYIDK